MTVPQLIELLKLFPEDMKAKFDMENIDMETCVNGGCTMNVVVELKEATNEG